MHGCRCGSREHTIEDACRPPRTEGQDDIDPLAGRIQCFNFPSALAARLKSHTPRLGAVHRPLGTHYYGPGAGATRLRSTSTAIAKIMHLPECVVFPARSWAKADAK